MTTNDRPLVEPTQRELLPEVSAFLARGPATLMIAGEHAAPLAGGTFATVDPADGAVLRTVGRADEQDVDRAVSAARAALAGTWGEATPRDRQNVLLRLADLVEVHAEWFAQVECLDTGKPANEVRFFDVPYGVDVLRYMAGWATKIHGRTIELSYPVHGRQRFDAVTLRQPVGVVAAVVPWNYPLMFAIRKIAPALAAGCTVVLKPAEQTPLSALRLVELASEAGLPAGALNVVTGFGDVGAALAAHPGVDKVTFTGSIETGRSIVTAAAGNLKKVSLELGGKAPIIVFDDADVDLAATTVADNAFLTQGESCIAAARVYAHEDVYERVVTIISARAREIVVGHGLDPKVQMGPLVSGEHREKVRELIHSGIADGATVAAGGADVDGPGYFLAPTVLADATGYMRIMQEEIFGPVVTVTPFSDEVEVIAAANGLPYGLGASVWTSDRSRAHRVSRAIEAGMVWVNCYGVADAALPFGGVKQSGWGRETSESNVLDHTEEKVVVEPYTA